MLKIQNEAPKFVLVAISYLLSILMTLMAIIIVCRTSNNGPSGGDYCTWVIDSYSLLYQQQPVVTITDSRYYDNNASMYRNATTFDWQTCSPVNILLHNDSVFCMIFLYSFSLLIILRGCYKFHRIVVYM